MRTFVPSLLLLIAATAAAPGCGSKDSNKSSDDDASEEAGSLIDKDIDEVSADELKEAVEALGYAPASKAKSGKITTISGKKGDDRVSVVHYELDDADTAKERVKITEERDGAGASKGKFALVVQTEPADQDKAEEILGRLTP